MDGSACQTFKTCRAALAGDRPHRVWSLIVTVFGDLAQAPGSRISGAALGQIVDELGVRPEAMRVALHRLRKDGWIESHREGRASVHLLTAAGRRQSAAASPLIYGAALPQDTALHVLLADDGSVESRRLLDAHALTGNHVQVGANVLVGLGPPPTDTEGLLVLTTSSPEVPDWIRQRVCPPALMAEYGGLNTALQGVSAKLGTAPDLPALPTAALRTLVVHSWRRVILRHPHLPEQFFPPDWPGPACRSLVHSILERLPIKPIEGLEGPHSTGLA